MAKKGEKKTQKSLSAEKIIPVKRKKQKFVEKTRPGPYKKTETVPLRHVLKNILKIAHTRKEAEQIIAQGKVKVNGKTNKRKTIGIGLFDVIELEGIKNAFVMQLTKKGALTAMPEKEKKTTKIVKIKKKKTGKKGKIFITTSNGRNIYIEKEKLSPGDSVILKIPEQKIKKILPLQKKAKVLLTGGKHVGEKAEVLEIKKGSITREKLVKLKSEKGVFETIEEYVLVIG